MSVVWKSLVIRRVASAFPVGRTVVTDRNLGDDEGEGLRAWFEMAIIGVVIGQHAYPLLPGSWGSTGNGSGGSNNVGHAAKPSYK